jgi:hypothetical protein
MKDIHAYENAMGGGEEEDSSSSAVWMAVPTIDTVTHDICLSTDKKSVELYDACVSIESIRNGYLCSMHPSEGFWIFKGSQNRSQGSNSYGVSWDPRAACTGGGGGNDDEPCSGVPTSVIKLPVGAPTTTEYAIACTSDSSAVVRINSIDQSYDDDEGKRVEVCVCVCLPLMMMMVDCIKKERKLLHTYAQDDPPPEKNRYYQFFDERFFALISNKVNWPRDKGVVELIPIVVGIGDV